MRIHSVVLSILLLAGVASAHASNGGADGLTERRLRKYRALCLEAICQREAGNNVAYYRLLERAVRINPNGAEALFELAQFGIANGIEVPVEEYLRKAHRLSPQNTDYTFELARFYFAVSDTSGVRLMRSLLSDNEMRDKAYAELCAYYDMNKDFERLCEVLEQWRPIRDDDEYISSQKFQSAMGMGRFADALAIADTLIAAYPSKRTQYLIFKGEALMGLQRYDELPALCRRVMADDPGNPGAQVLMYRYALAVKNKKVERESLFDMAVNPFVNMQTRVAALKYYIDGAPVSERKAVRDSLVDKLLPLPEKDPAIYAVIIDQMQNENIPDSLMIPLYNKVLDINPSDELSRLHLMQNALVTQNYDELNRLSTDGLKENPRHPLFYYFAGAALQIAKKDTASLEMFSRGLKYVDNTTHTELVSTYYSGYADALHKVGRKAEAYVMYDSALIYNSNNVMCLNNYAYFLSLDNIRLDKALEMSALTIKESPEEPTFLDTYAWILFLQGKYEEARKYIDKAMENSDMSIPDNATLADHAGDIYYHLGLVKEAVGFWNDALRLDPSADLVRRKVSARKFIKE